MIRAGETYPLPRQMTRDQGLAYWFSSAHNERAVRLWQVCGFDIAGRLPKAFNHQTLGYVDALLMFRQLDRTQ